MQAEASHPLESLSVLGKLGQARRLAASMRTRRCIVYSHTIVLLCIFARYVHKGTCLMGLFFGIFAGVFEGLPARVFTSVLL
jgi:hypothetical protein